VVVGDGVLAACGKTDVGHKNRFVSHNRILCEATLRNNIAASNIGRCVIVPCVTWQTSTLHHLLTRIVQQADNHTMLPFSLLIPTFFFSIPALLLASGNLLAAICFSDKIF